MDKEWEKLEKISAWNMTNVRSKKDPNIALLFFSHMSMQSFRGVSSVTPQDEETAIREMLHGLADALRGMGQSEREIQLHLASISVSVVPPMAGPRVTVPNLRKAHDLHVSTGKIDSADEASLDYTSDVSVIDEMGPVSSKTFRKLGTLTRRYLGVGMVHGALGTVEAVAFSSTMRSEQVSSQERRTSRLS